MQCPVPLTSPSTPLLQCPANETHFRVQQESLSKPHTGTLWPCWSWGAADGGAMKNNGQLLPPFLKVPDMRNPTWPTTLIWCLCSTIKGHWEQGTWQSEWSFESSGVVLCYRGVASFSGWTRSSSLFSPCFPPPAPKRKLFQNWNLLKIIKSTLRTFLVSLCSLILVTTFSFSLITSSSSSDIYLTNTFTENKLSFLSGFLWLDWPAHTFLVSAPNLAQFSGELLFFY